MEGQNNNLRTAKRVAVALLVGLAAGALFYKLDSEMTQGCGLLHVAGWVVLELVRPAVNAGLASAQAYVSDNAGFLRQLPQIAATLGSLLCGLAG